MKPMHFPFLMFCCAVAFTVFPLGAQAEETPRSAMRRGLKELKQGNYTNAVAALQKTVPEFPAIGNYNLGCAYYRQGDYKQAIRSFTEALRTTDVQLQAKAYYNCGNAMMAQTTTLSRPEEISRAIELCFQATDHYEKAILLEPEDLDAKVNYEKAANLRTQLEVNKGLWLFKSGEEHLKKYEAKKAQELYQQAKKQFNHILENVEQNHPDATATLPKVEERLTLLKTAVEETDQNLKTAIQQIEDYQYLLAAKRLSTETDNRKYAFDIKPDLKKKYEEVIRKNEEILKIIQELSTLSL